MIIKTPAGHTGIRLMSNEWPVTRLRLGSVKTKHGTSDHYSGRVAAKCSRGLSYKYEDLAASSIPVVLSLARPVQHDAEPQRDWAGHRSSPQRAGGPVWSHCSIPGVGLPLPLSAHVCAYQGSELWLRRLVPCSWTGTLPNPLSYRVVLT